MKRIWSFAVLFIAFVVTGLEASAYSSDRSPAMLSSSSSNLQIAEGDNCGAEGYSWLDENGQLIEY